MAKQRGCRIEQRSSIDSAENAGNHLGSEESIFGTAVMSLGSVDMYW